MTQRTKREIEATAYPHHVPLTFHRGMVTNGDGKELPTEAYLTYGSTAGMDGRDADIEIHGDGAHEAARLIEAVPDMLAALRPLANWTWGRKTKPTEEDCERARAAIIKALGNGGE